MCEAKLIICRENAPLKLRAIGFLPPPLLGLHPPLLAGLIQEGKADFLPCLMKAAHASFLSDASACLSF